MDKGVSDLFEEYSLHWGTRGDPYLWEDLKQYFSNKELPCPAEQFELEFFLAFEQLTGVSLDSTQEPFLVQKYAHGGMSSGYISPKFWMETALPLLVERLKA
ncbi:hypothetical protein [Paenibacillus paeoniae]|uniref:Uncharacterized protein n=1 Tax=Paenibacillus paeoniae TaxID=2292705 RepID=A0A371PKI1_9BACL|nr:hypothetical protein [Paenibacillus paeoniae]REK76711.1 hypothetical protein DX130_06640 [Paenibacillus paeoniae]